MDPVTVISVALGSLLASWITRKIWGPPVADAVKRMRRP
jgi:hypothetical protein